MVKAMPGWVKSFATLLFGPFFVPTVTYEAAFFRAGARAVLAAVGRDIPVGIVGGLTSLSTIEGAVAGEGFDFVQCARALIRQPDLVNKFVKALESDAPTDDIRSECTHCNMCVVSTLNPNVPSRCVLRPAGGDIEDIRTPSLSTSQSR